MSIALDVWLIQQYLLQEIYYKVRYARIFMNMCQKYAFAYFNILFSINTQRIWLGPQEYVTLKGYDNLKKFVSDGGHLSY